MAKLPLRKDWVSYYFLAHLAGLLNSFLGLLIWRHLARYRRTHRLLKKTSTLVPVCLLAGGYIHGNSLSRQMDSSSRPSYYRTTISISLWSSRSCPVTMSAFGQGRETGYLCKPCGWSIGSVLNVRVARYSHIDHLENICAKRGSYR